MNQTAKPWLKQYPDDVKTEIEVPDITLNELFEQAVDRFPKHDALSFYGLTTRYQELSGQINRFASALQQDGIKKSDRIALMLPNCPQYIISYYATLKIGATVTQVNPMLVERELEFLLNDSGAETIVIYDAVYPVLKKIQANTAVKNVIVVSLVPNEKTFEPDRKFETVLESGTGQLKKPDINPKKDVAILQYTGGTTGRSKGAMLTHRNIVANTLQVTEFFKHSSEFGKESILTVLPLFHVFGMTSCMNYGLYLGAKLILLPRFEVEEVLNTVKKEQPSFFPGVPTMYIAIANHPDAENYNIDSIRTCNSGGSAMPLEVMKKYEAKTGAQVLEGYGLSETSPVTHANPAFAERKPGSIGIPLPSTEYKIVDIATGKEEMSDGEEGEIIIRGPQVMKGYWNMPEETEKTLRDGWLYTGDIARMDEDGYAYIVDRKKDMIIASGYNIYPREVEEVLYLHPSIVEAAVIGVPDQYRGETVKAVVVLKEGETANSEAIIAHCQKYMAAYKVPKLVEFREELPKSTVGKILRRSVREAETAGKAGS
ncbi:MAG TPA: long-chain fatty acid--CoA ligase [Bacillales bacterium]|nr:long-chain fatty acid--CoA ligase [Bacillales bacterium]